MLSIPMNPQPIPPPFPLIVYNAELYSNRNSMKIQFSQQIGTQHELGPNGERNQANSAANSHQQTQYGSSDSTAQALTETINQNGVNGNKASSNTNSVFYGNDGSAQQANSGSNTQTWQGNGVSGSSASSQSSTFSNGNNPFGGGANSGANSGASSSTNSFSGGGNAGASANAGSNTYQQPQYNPYSRPPPNHHNHNHYPSDTYDGLIFNRGY